MTNMKEVRQRGADARAAGRPKSSCPSPLHDVTRSGIRYREHWYAGWDAMDNKLREEAAAVATKSTCFFDRAKADAYEKESREAGRFVRRSEALIRVGNRVAAGAAAHRPRYRFIIVERAGK
jgi:ribosome modulation factor